MYRHWHQNVGIIIMRLGDGRGLSDAHCDVAIVNLDIYREVRSYLPSATAMFLFFCRTRRSAEGQGAGEGRLTR